MIKTVNWATLDPVDQKKILQRAPLKNSELSMRSLVSEILAKVKSTGDNALRELTQTYDRVLLSALKVSQDEIQQAGTLVDSADRLAIEFAIRNIQKYHEAQLPSALAVEIVPGVKIERVMRPIQRVGLYVPGGTAPLVSTVMMLAVPASIAGAEKIILCTPPNAAGQINPAILLAAQLCGVRDIFKIGGAQAIAAMAYGTESVPKVDKIFGPGNSWVTLAKALVANDPAGSAIDLPAGPSELLIIADQSANPEYIAADLLSQAEHGSDSQVILITTCADLIANVESSIAAQLSRLSRGDIIRKSLQHSALIFAADLNTALQISNDYAPEHLILQVQDPESLIPKINSAGSVFCGHFTPETVGDYVTGSNHVLPTYGYAKNYSGLSLADFMKSIPVQTVTESGLRNIGPVAEKLAALEGLDAHLQAVRIRLNDLGETNEY